ncbi:UNVERIFIED_CONTAM: hypothetical protein Slati_1404500 [Sesamum latifolium]|uniref:Uncharacterized protein n=1 Tax=Sesamum latifolium TaxID=2727402 RepID=A0AAW2X8L5_9LAMI
MLVADLMDPVGGKWNSRKIQELFWLVDSDIILSIPLSRTGEEDIWVWHYSKNGIFSVRSAYHLACDLDDRRAQLPWFDGSIEVEEIMASFGP